jgi:hypothetical protein
VTGFLPAMPITWILFAYQYPLAAPVRPLYRCHLCEDKRKIMLHGPD